MTRENRMKSIAMGMLVFVALTGCGIGGTPGQTSSRDSKLSSGDGKSDQGKDPEKGTAGGGGSALDCTTPCEAEEVAYMECAVDGSACSANLTTMKNCQATQPPPPIDPCKAQEEALSVCGAQVPKSACTALIAALSTCRNNQPPPAIDPNSKGCKPPPPPPIDCKGANFDPCLPILDLYKGCMKTTQPTGCAAVLAQFGACEVAGNTPPPVKP